MRLIMTLLVRDEEDILKTNIEYHLSHGVDFIIATDNCSTDSTKEILKIFERKGKLHYIYEASDDYSQHEWVTRMARMACNQYGADWVINNDADEFWWPETDATLKSLLNNIPHDVLALSADRTNFIPNALTEPAPFFDTMVIRETQSLNAIGQPLPGKVCHRALPDIDVMQGNHEVSLNGKSIHPISSNITILHFPVRTYRQFENKIAKGGAAYLNNNRLPENVGITWRRLYQLYLNSQLDAYYNNLILNDVDIKKGIADGNLVVDFRLKEYLHNNYETRLLTK